MIVRVDKMIMITVTGPKETREPNLCHKMVKLPLVIFPEITIKWDLAEAEPR